MGTLINSQLCYIFGNLRLYENNNLMNTSRPKVIICDDHIAVRTGVMTILKENEIVVAGHCDNVASLEKLVEESPDAVVITDLAIDEVPFQDLVKRLRGKSANCKIVVYSMREAPGTIGLCYDAGVLAFVPKRSDPSELILAVEHANNGQRYLPPSVATALAQFHIDAKVPINLLSARELELFVGYANGDSLEALAKKLGLSEGTVNNMLSRIAKKLSLPRSMFAETARKYGLLNN